ncbi:hypothetical protein KR222_010810 [Zaprionus bogoriensis]|nr:hypothetical protein KR222_010810 [Zaprionus bogoriensis]
MLSSRNIIKRCSINRCPLPALGRLPARDTTTNCQRFANARLTNCCRKLYTRWFGRGYFTSVTEALATRRRKYNMSWLKVALRLKDVDTAGLDAGRRLQGSLDDCDALQANPCTVCIAARPHVDSNANPVPDSDNATQSPPPPVNLNRNVRVQHLIVRARR